MPKRPAKKKRKATRTTAPRASAGTAVIRNVAATPPSAPSERQPPRRARESRIAIAGIGASAGGLEAFSQLLSALPPDPGMAFVLVQHLAPQHESVLPILLSGHTRLPVVQATEGMRVEPNHVYVIPPNVQMGIADDVLHLMPRPQDRSQYMPIDYFLRTLADALQERAIGVILSGTASDGAAGIREIKSLGGITLAQDPESAKYDGMPRAAIATGMVDMILPADKLAAALCDIARHPYLRQPRAPEAPEADQVEAAETPLHNEQLQRVFALLRSSSGVDFKNYKLPTIERRLQRRMVLHKFTRFEQYLRHLQENPGEVHALYQDLLIHVTRFFREPDSFKALGEDVCPQIIAAQKDDNPIRAWVAGCSSGEEAYSLAITLLECLGDHASSVPIQVFATDISETAIEHARNGVYPESISADVSPERLRRYFTKVEGGYRVAKMVRDLCIFARQDLTRDPPFSKLDLVLCRNVLIYMTAALQKKLLTVFHYALKPNGYLVLGHAETVGTHTDLFGVEDKRHRIYKKKLIDSSLPAMTFPIEYSALPPSRRRPPSDAPPGGQTAQNEANRVVLERYAPPGVIVDDELQIVQFRGQTGLFLEPAPGDPSMNLLKMAREGLLYGLRTALHSARKLEAPVRKDGLKVKQNGGWRDAAVEVIPLTGTAHGHFLVLFHSDGPALPAAPSRGRAKPGGATKKTLPEEDDRVRRLQDELAASREYLQSIIQEVEAANEELQSANEEILSSNEELQSTNEELDTAKEELQSTNEELNTVNEELHGRNEELSRANSDLVNLLGSVHIAIVIVAGDLRIRRFTPMAERVLNLIASDVGRPISHIKPNIDCPDLEKMITEAIDTVTPQEREVQDRQGNRFSLRVRPYKNVENRIDGAVLALFDTQTGEAEATRVRSESDRLFEGVPVPLLLLDRDFRVQRANASFRETFGYEASELENQNLFTLGKGVWNVPALRAHVEHAASDGRRTDPLALDHRFPNLGQRRMRVTARRLADGGDSPSLLLALVEGQ